ncbi:MAG: PAS domain S-box protein [Candidatus Sericytochromatia bacterium]|nr:PAS domain S-box protein [Candidatus Tanganyikabacteria bacterium]
MVGDAARLEPWHLNLGLLFGKVRDAIVVANAETGRIVLWNPAAERLFGYTAEEAVGQPVEIIVPDRLRRAHEQAFERYRETARGLAVDAPAPREVPARGKSGEEFPVELTVSPIEGASVAGSYVLAIIRDSRGRQAQQQLQRETIERLERLDALKDRYISFLSHELRTPIQAIMGFGNIMEDELAGPLSAEQRACVTNIIAGSEVLLSLVNDLLDMSRIQSGTFALDLETLRMEPIVDRVLEILAPLADLKRLQLAWEPGGAVPQVVGDHQRIAQILMNLVNNAIKFTPDGGTIRVAAHTERETLVCEVVDSGEGIPARDLGELFKPFGRLPGARLERVPGTGLGLSIVKELVVAHGGTVGVRSTVGTGSTFWFTLPLAH